MLGDTIRYQEHHIEKHPGKQFGLLGLKFKDTGGKEFIWWPKWEDIRLIFMLAIATEFFNESIYKWSQTKEFLKVTQSFPEMLRVWAKDHLSQERQRLIQLLNDGNFKQAAELLTKTDLLEVAEWVDKRA